MRVEKVDVTLEIDYDEILALGDGEVAGRHIIEKLRRGADHMADQVRGRVVTDTPPEVVMHKRASVLTGQDYLLVASRWQVEVPEGAVLS